MSFCGSVSTWVSFSSPRSSAAIVASSSSTASAASPRPVPNVTVIVKEMEDPRWRRDEGYDKQRQIRR